MSWLSMDSLTFKIRMKKIRYIFAFVLLALTWTVSAQDGIEIKTPERIERMLQNMPISNIPASGQFQCTELSSTLMFYTEAENGVTVQLGARLFSDAVHKSYDPIIINFVERLWVELLLRKTTSSQSALLKEYGVRIVLGGYPLGTGNFKQLDQALNIINSISSLSITTGGNEIDMFMRDKSGTTLHIYIPASRDLLFPYDKKEHEERMIRDLKSTRSSYKQTLPESKDYRNTDNGLLAIGGDCYMIDSLTNDVFFNKNRSVLYDMAFPEETMRNMLMGASSPSRLSGIYLDIAPHTYNRDIKNFRIQMAQFLGYVQQQGYRFYTGNVGRNGNKSQCLLALFHPVYNYLHILSVSFSPDQLEAQGEKTIKADLSTFIPQHNIKNLFQEK